MTSRSGIMYDRMSRPSSLQPHCPQLEQFDGRTTTQHSSSACAVTDIWQGSKQQKQWQSTSPTYFIAEEESHPIYRSTNFLRKIVGSWNLLLSIQSFTLSAQWETMMATAFKPRATHSNERSTTRPEGKDFSHNTTTIVNQSTTPTSSFEAWTTEFMDTRCTPLQFLIPWIVINSVSSFSKLHK